MRPGDSYAFLRFCKGSTSGPIVGIVHPGELAKRSSLVWRGKVAVPALHLEVVHRRLQRPAQTVAGRRLAARGFDRMNKCVKYLESMSKAELIGIKGGPKVTQAAKDALAKALPKCKVGIG